VALLILLKKLLPLARPNHQALLFRMDLPRKGYPPAAKVYLQDELSPRNRVALFAGNRVELSPFSFSHARKPMCYKPFRMTFLHQMEKQLPWNDILTKKGGRGEGAA